MAGFDHRQEIRAAQVRLLYEQLPSALIATILNAVILTAVLWKEIDTPLLAGWLLVILVVALGREALRRSYLGSPSVGEHSHAWGNFYIYGVAANATLWGVAGFVFFRLDSVVHQVFLAFVLMGMVSGSISTLSSLRGAHLLFLTALLPYAVRLVSISDGLHLAMAGMLIVYVTMMAMIGSRLSGTVAESLRLRFDNIDLLQDLTLAKDGLEKAYLSMERRVEERTADLAKSEEALRNADRRKDEFLAMLGHELRNPLAPIRNALQVLHKPGIPEATTKWAGEVIDRQVDRLSRLVDDLLDVSRIVYGKISLHETPLEIASVVHHAIEGSLPLIESRHQELSVHIPREPLWIKGDIVRLEQVISNLLHNAAKYSENGKRIEVEVSGSEQWGTVRIKDQGIGIPSDLLPYVFDLFAQANHSLARTQGGLGIGLTVAKRLTEMHGGYVEARSQGTGRGSEFLVYLPRQAAPAQTEMRTAAPGGAAEPNEPLRILIVDDNEDAVETLALLLSLEGYTVAKACDGMTGLSEAKRFSPQVVLLDIGMPGMDGYQVARELRARETTRSIAIIALTGYGQPEDRARAEAAGFTDHLTKPVKPELLYGILKAQRTM